MIDMSILTAALVATAMVIYVRYQIEIETWIAERIIDIIEKKNVKSRKQH